MFLQRLIFTWFIIVFFLSGLFINFLQLCVLPLYLINRRWYHACIAKLCYSLYSEITFLGEWWGGIDLIVYGTAHDIEMMGKENWIAIGNHISDIDWLVSWIFCERMGILGDTMCFMKNMIKYMPGVGWAYWFADWGFLKRDWKKDEKEMGRVMNVLKNEKHHYCMMLYCEGTRRTEEKLKASRDYAERNSIEPLKHHLLPRTKGFATVVQELQQHTPAVYDVEMAFIEEDKAKLKNIIKREKIEVHLNIRRIPIESVACGTSQEATDFCIQLYRNKDSLMDHFVKNKKFAAPVIPIPRQKSNFYMLVAHNLIVGLLLCFFASYFGVAATGACLLFLVFCAYGSLAMLDRVTQTKKGSQFGLASTTKKDT